MHNEARRGSAPSPQPTAWTSLAGAATGSTPQSSALTAGPSSAAHAPRSQIERCSPSRRRRIRVVSEQIWVVGPDPLQTGTAHAHADDLRARFSAANRLIAFAELVPSGP